MSAILLINRYQNFNMAKLFMCTTNMVLNYDLYTMLTAPFKRDISKNILLTFWIFLPTALIFLIVSNSAILEALRIPGRIKLRLEDTIDEIIYPRIIIGQSLVYILYQSTKVFMIITIARYYF